MIAALAGALSAMAAALLAGLFYVEVGAFNVAAAVPHNTLTYWVTNTAMRSSVRLRARGVRSPAAFSGAQVLAGFRTYEARCVVCHGAPGIGAREPWVDGMTPAPPYLLDAAREFSAPELYWLIRNGVKMTGMPAWDRQCSDREIWELVAFLKALPRMNSTGYADLRAANSRAQPTAAAMAAPPCSGSGV